MKGMSIMATKTFSGRADAEKLAFVNSLTQAEHGMSFGQYCASILLDAINQQRKLPASQEDAAQQAKREQAYDFIRGFASLPHDEAIGRMDDGTLRDLIASRYE